MLFKFMKNIQYLSIFVFIYCSNVECYCIFNSCDDNSRHSLCKFESNDPKHRCIDKERTVRSIKDKQDILDKINSRRDKVASGDIRSLPPAENMIKMVWSDTLENSAQRWADHCLPYKELDYKDICKDSDGVNIGQNIATVVGDSPGLTPAILVDVWYMELLNMNSSLISRYRPSNQTRQHHYDYFTQLVWAESNQVGCGGVKFKELINERTNRTINRLVCNFSPGGNQIGRPVYDEGYPCSRCPYGGSCDFKYKYLCNAESPVIMKGKLNSYRDIFSNNFANATINSAPTNANENKTQNEEPMKTGKNSNTVLETFNIELGDENVTGFDYFAHMLRVTESSTEKVTTNIKTCKDVMPVEDFIEIFKKRLIKDQVLKQYLLTSKILESKENFENGYNDATVAEIVNHIHSTKVTSTTAKPTEPDYVNSTLLVNLVEAVIFRNNDNTSTAGTVEQTTNFISDVSAVKIKAELGEVLTNLHSTGHYFFPEDDNEHNANETTDSYYDITSPSVSDIVLEIQDLKRNQRTKDFLDEIIGSDVDTDNESNSNLPSSTILNSEENVTLKSCLMDVHCATLQNSDISLWVFHTKTPALSSDRHSDPSHNTATGTDVEHQTHFQNSEDNKSNNLKSNIFDKMLSDEMLIIQQNLHRKDINQIPSMHISTGNNAPTPTLEVKQRWSVMNFLSNAITFNESHQLSEGKGQNEFSNQITANESQLNDNYKQISCNNSRDKVVGLRSLTDITPDLEISQYPDNAKLCTCMNENTYTKCNHRCTGPNVQQEYSQSLRSNTDHLCSRTVSTSQVTHANIPFYITSEMYHFYTVTPYPIFYPWLISDISKKRTKHRSNKKTHGSHVYYGSEDRKETSKEKTDYYYDNNDDIEKIKNEIDLDQEEKKDKPSSVKNVVINVEYEDSVTTDNGEKNEDVNEIHDILEQGEIQVLNKDKFTNEIVNDLKKYYNDVVIKDCYCSSAAGNFTTFKILVCIFLCRFWVALKCISQ